MEYSRIKLSLYSNQNKPQPNNPSTITQLLTEQLKKLTYPLAYSLELETERMTGFEWEIMLWQSMEDKDEPKIEQCGVQSGMLRQKQEKMFAYQLNYKPPLRYNLDTIVVVLENILDIIVQRNINLGLIKIDKRKQEIED